jgi:TolA-binding protein
MEVHDAWGKGRIERKELSVGALIVLLLVSLGIVKLIAGGPHHAAPAVTASQNNEDPFASENVSTMVKVREKIAEERRVKAEADIADHEEAISRDWSAADTPDRFMAVGNLKQYQLGDYNAAIQSYRTLVDSYPKHNKTPQAYIEMARCYEEMGNEEQARYIYREMIQVLDPSLQHVAYAKTRLGE